MKEFNCKNFNSNRYKIVKHASIKKKKNGPFITTLPPKTTVLNWTFFPSVSTRYIRFFCNMHSLHYQFDGGHHSNLSEILVKPYLSDLDLRFIVNPPPPKPLEQGEGRGSRRGQNL